MAKNVGIFFGVSSRVLAELHLTPFSKLQVPNFKNPCFWSLASYASYGPIWRMRQKIEKKKSKKFEIFFFFFQFFPISKINGLSWKNQSKNFFFPPLFQPSNSLKNSFFVFSLSSSLYLVKRTIILVIFGQKIGFFGIVEKIYLYSF